MKLSLQKFTISKLENYRDVRGGNETTDTNTTSIETGPAEKVCIRTSQIWINPRIDTRENAEIGLL